MVIQEPDPGPRSGGVTGREGMGTKNLLLCLTPTLFD